MIPEKAGQNVSPVGAFISTTPKSRFSLHDPYQDHPLKPQLTTCHTCEGPIDAGCASALTFLIECTFISVPFYRPFSVQKIPHSNLMLLVVDTLCPCGSKQLTITPKEVTDGQECDLKHDFMYRRKASKCVNYHPEVKYYE